jgi:TetR/AcrR family transcriptional repressor of bet genes
MAMVKRNPAKQTTRGGASGARQRQRLRLIDACISALHIHGPSRTTVAKVVAIAGMSPGIVRFYFRSKAAMLVASLEHLSVEFEQRVLVPVARLRHEPVRALTTLVELYLDPEIASPRKVSVWYSFWGEASSRQEYFDICGQKDARFAELVRELIELLIAKSAIRHLDADGVALGLIGVLEVLWQDFAFQSEANIDRNAARRRCLAYLHSVFPEHFGARPGIAAGEQQLAAAQWQIAVHESALAAPGDFITAELSCGATLVWRGPDGEVSALRNQCAQLPHALLSARSGRLRGAVECPIHGCGPADPGALSAVVQQDGLVMVRAARGGAEAAPAALAWGTAPGAGPMPALRVAAAALEFTIPVAWRTLVEQWLEYDLPHKPRGRLAGLLSHAHRAAEAESGRVRWQARVHHEAHSWFAQRYATLAGSAYWYRLFLPPNQLLERREDGLSIQQVLPAADGGCRLRWLEYRSAGAERRLRAMSYLARRLRATWIAQDIAALQSVRGLA